MLPRSTQSHLVENRGLVEIQAGLGRLRQGLIERQRMERHDAAEGRSEIGRHLGPGFGFLWMERGDRAASAVDAADLGDADTRREGERRFDAGDLLQGLIEADRAKGGWPGQFGAAARDLMLFEIGLAGAGLDRMAPASGHGKEGKKGDALCQSTKGLYCKCSSHGVSSPITGGVDPHYRERSLNTA